MSPQLSPQLSPESIEKELDNIERILILEEEQGAEINAVQGQTRIRVAMDSGAVRHVTHPRTLPAGVVMRPNVSGKHFTGAGGEVIERFGACDTLTTMTTGAQVVNEWELADVARPLHSVSQTTGPFDHPTGKYDVLFSNKRCVVVQPGVVEHIMKHLKPVAEYGREGNLYTAEMVLQPFGGQGQGK